jgi:hypothetical protein
MARKKKEKGNSIQSTAVVRDGVTIRYFEHTEECPLSAEVIVDVREVEGSRSLVRVHDDSPSWGHSPESLGQMAVALEAGAIVRIDPPVDVPDSTIAALRDLFVRSGAVAVRVSARRKNDVVIIEPAPGATLPKRVIGREAVESLVESANVEDRPALKALCEDVMSKAGL